MVAGCVYRSDHVGSFLRPGELKKAREAHSRGQLSLDLLRELEDREIRRVLDLQKDVGVDIYSDGELRRSIWSGNFQASVDGYVDAPRAVDRPLVAGGAVTATGVPRSRVIGSRLRQRRRLTEHEVPFLRLHAPGPFKITLPASSHVLARGYNPSVTDAVYGGRRAALADVASIVHAEVRSLAQAGVPYVQLDNPHYLDYASEESNARWRAAGIDVDQALQDDIDADNRTIAGVDRTKVTVAMHLCRGNVGRGRDLPAGWHNSGGYDAIAERLFSQLEVDRWLLEYDSERAGNFAPLRYMPRGTQVVLGLITTKSRELESQDSLARRIEEASKYVSLDNLALSPQCGFSSTVDGNPLTEDDERRKLALVVETARTVWG